MQSRNTLSQKLRAILVERGTSQSILAELARASPGQLSKLLNGKRKWSLPYIEQIARALELSPEALVEGTPEAELLQPNGGVVERDYAEKLATDLARTASRLQESEADLAAMRAEHARLEAALTDAQGARARAVREGEVANERARRCDAEAREARVEVAKLRRDLDLVTRERDQQKHVSGTLKAALEASNRQVVVNYDAWRQADAQARGLAHQLGAKQKESQAAALFAGLVGLGLGVAAQSKS